MRPPVWSISRVMLSAVTDLPEPDSPTMASVSPCGHVQVEITRTTVDRPWSVAKATLRPWTSSRFRVWDSGEFSGRIFAYSCPARTGQARRARALSPPHRPTFMAGTG